jgi:hypothetical protein
MLMRKPSEIRKEPNTTFMAWLKESEARVNMSGPLASELYQPAKKPHYVAHQ